MTEQELNAQEIADRIREVGSRSGVKMEDQIRGLEAFFMAWDPPKKDPPEQIASKLNSASKG